MRQLLFELFVHNFTNKSDEWACHAQNVFTIANAAVSLGSANLEQACTYAFFASVNG